MYLGPFLNGRHVGRKANRNAARAGMQRALSEIDIIRENMAPAREQAASSHAVPRHEQAGAAHNTRENVIYISNPGAHPQAVPQREQAADANNILVFSDLGARAVARRAQVEQPLDANDIELIIELARSPAALYNDESMYSDTLSDFSFDAEDFGRPANERYNRRRAVVNFIHDEHLHCTYWNFTCSLWPVRGYERDQQGLLSSMHILFVQSIVQLNCFWRLRIQPTLHKLFRLRHKNSKSATAMNTLHKRLLDTNQICEVENNSAPMYIFPIRAGHWYENSRHYAHATSHPKFRFHQKCLVFVILKNK